MFHMLLELSDLLFRLLFGFTRNPGNDCGESRVCREHDLRSCIPNGLCRMRHAFTKPFRFGLNPGTLCDIPAVDFSPGLLEEALELPFSSGHVFRDSITDTQSSFYHPLSRWAERRSDS